MTVHVNHETVETADGITLLALIEGRKLNPERVLAGVNGEVCPVAAYGSLRLKNGDEIELFSFVCGG